jgi:multidrug efflux pump subunit AcrA (membrane-fusion protein)
MTQLSTDLSLLARAGGDGTGTRDDTPRHTTGAAVPPPRRRWKTRVLLPGAVFGATAGTLLLAAGSALWPATPLRVVPVVVKAGMQAAGKVIVQAPGWVEADPFAAAVSALADGVVAEVLVLEGQAVEANKVVARLIDADAKLGLARAEASVQEAQAAVAAAESAYAQFTVVTARFRRVALRRPSIPLGHCGR